MTILRNYSELEAYFQEPEKIVKVGLDAAKEIVWNIFMMENNKLTDSCVTLRSKGEAVDPRIEDADLYEWEIVEPEKNTIIRFYLLDDFGNGIIDVEIQ